MKIILFTSNSLSATFFVEEFLKHRYKDTIAVVLVSQLKGSIFKKIKMFYKYLKKTSLLFLLYKLYEGFGGKKIRKIAKNNDIPLIETDDINDEKLVEKLKSMHPDIYVCYVQQILKKPLLSIPKKGTLNAHGSILPKYRGAAQYFWYLHNGDVLGGVTIHYMEEGLDTGDIIYQKEFDISKKDSMFNIHMRLGKLFGETLDEAIFLIETGKAKRIIQTQSEEPYLTLPTRKEMKSFLKKGCKIF